MLKALAHARQIQKVKYNQRMNLTHEVAGQQAHCVPWSLPEIFVFPRLLFVVLTIAVMPASHAAGQMLAVTGGAHLKVVGSITLVLVACYAFGQALLMYSIAKKRWELGIIYGTLGLFGVQATDPDGPGAPADQKEEELTDAAGGPYREGGSLDAQKGARTDSFMQLVVRNGPHHECLSAGELLPPPSTADKSIGPASQQAADAPGPTQQHSEEASGPSGFFKQMGSYALARGLSFARSKVFPLPPTNAQGAVAENTEQQWLPAVQPGLHMSSAAFAGIEPSSCSFKADSRQRTPRHAAALDRGPGPLGEALELSTQAYNMQAQGHAGVQVSAPLQLQNDAQTAVAPVVESLAGAAGVGKDMVGSIVDGVREHCSELAANATALVTSGIQDIALEAGFDVSAVLDLGGKLRAASTLITDPLGLFSQVTGMAPEQREEVRQAFSDIPAARAPSRVSFLALEQRMDTTALQGVLSKELVVWGTQRAAGSTGQGQASRGLTKPGTNADGYDDMLVEKVEGAAATERTEGEAGAAARGTGQTAGLAKTADSSSTPPGSADVPIHADDKEQLSTGVTANAEQFFPSRSGRDASAAQPHGLEGTSSTGKSTEKEPALFGSLLVKAGGLFTPHTNESHGNVLGSIAGKLAKLGNGRQTTAPPVANFMVPVPLGNKSLVIQAITGNKVRVTSFCPSELLHASGWKSAGHIGMCSLSGVDQLQIALTLTYIMCDCAPEVPLYACKK